MRAIPALVVSLLVPGAALAQPAAPSGAPTPAVAPLDAEILGAAASAKKVRKAKVRVNAAGAVDKLSVYHEDESRIPEAVKAAAAKEFPGSKVLYYETEWYADVGRVVEVEVKTQDKKECEFSARPDGTLLYVECRFPPKALTAEVKATVDKLVPGGKVVEAETKKGPGLDEISVESQKDGVLHYIRVKPTGELIAHTLKVPAEFEVPAP